MIECEEITEIKELIKNLIIIGNKAKSCKRYDIANLCWAIIAQYKSDDIYGLLSEISPRIEAQDSQIEPRQSFYNIAVWHYYDMELNIPLPILSWEEAVEFCRVAVTIARKEHCRHYIEPSIEELDGLMTEFNNLLSDIDKNYITQDNLSWVIERESDEYTNIINLLNSIGESL